MEILNREGVLVEGGVIHILGGKAYGWIVTKDHFYEGYLKSGQKGYDPTAKSRVGTIGPRGVSDSIVARLKAGEGIRWRTTDDDGELCYDGLYIGPETDPEVFGPLDDFAKPDAGAVNLLHWQDGKWVPIN
jgi:hypothetical protein